MTRLGKPWLRESMREDGTLSRSDAVNLQFRKLAAVLDIDIRGAGFGKLRHTYRTASDGANDLNAALRIMGHEVPGISAHYVHSIDENQLRRIADHVRTWLYGKQKRGKKN